jgi:curved DNA-binding protein CbpA
VRKVLKSYTLFRTLGFTRQASTNNIKRQYKKLSLLVHPDKNAAPGAEEAFKRVNNAYDILRDPDSRSRYAAVASDLRGQYHAKVNARREQRREERERVVSDLERKKKPLFVALILLPVLVLMLWGCYSLVLTRSTGQASTGARDPSGLAWLSLTGPTESHPHAYQSSAGRTVYLTQHVWLALHVSDSSRAQMEELIDNVTAELTRDTATH